MKPELENFKIGQASPEITYQAENFMMALSQVCLKPAVSAFVKQESHVSGCGICVAPPCISG